MKTWVKLYTEIIDDPEQGSLTWSQRGIWSALLALAGKIDERDGDGMETGRLDVPQRVAWYLRCDLTELNEALAEFKERGMVHMGEGGMIYLTNYGKRQAAIPVADRVARHRERQRKASYYNRDDTETHQTGNGDDTEIHQTGNEAVTNRYALRNAPVTTRYTEAEADTDTESDTEAAAAARDVTFGIVLQDYENNFGILGSRRQYEKFQAIWDDYPVPEMHAYAREQMRQFADRPNLGYYEQCLATIAARDYILLEEDDDDHAPVETTPVCVQGQAPPPGGTAPDRPPATGPP